MTAPDARTTNRPASRRALAPLIATCGLVLALTACGAPADRAETPEPAAESSSSSAAPSQSSTAPTEDVAEEIVITISDFSFDVPESVPAGAEITVVNEDSSFHTVTADDGTFDVDVPSGESVTFTAPDAGEFAFHCTPHPQMTATLVVG